MITRSVTRPGTLTITTETSSGVDVNVIAYPNGFNSFGVTTDSVGDRRSPNPNQFSKTDMDYWRGTRVLRQFSYPESVSTQDGSYGFGVGAPDSPNQSLASEMALSRYNERLRGSLDLSVDLAQAGQVRKMLVDAVSLRKKILQLPRHVVSGFWPKTTASAKYVGSKHLEWIYGWRPLASSIHELIGMIGTHIDRLNRVEATAKVADSSPYTGAVPFGTPGGTVTYSARCKIVGFYSAPGSVQRAAMYTSLNPVSIAWELLPYSFVADWVYDIGGYLRGLETAMISQQSFVSGFTTETSRIIVDAKCSSSEFDAVSSDVGSAEAKTVLSYKNRYVNTHSPTPSLPSFKVALGSSQLLAAASLLSIHLTGRKRN